MGFCRLRPSAGMAICRTSRARMDSMKEGAPRELTPPRKNEATAAIPAATMRMRTNVTTLLAGVIPIPMLAENTRRRRDALGVLCIAGLLPISNVAAIVAEGLEISSLAFF